MSNIIGQSLNINPKFKINIDNYEKGDKIGTGGFGDVFIATEKSTGKVFAAKVSHFSRDDERFRRSEIELLAKANYPSLVKFIGYSEIDFDHRNYPTIILHLYQNGSLDKFRGEYTGTFKYIICLGVAISMRHFHSKHIVYRDLKPENILLDEHFYPIISDFGISKESHQGIGTVNYMAPEMLEGEKYNLSVDAYAYSMFLYWILTGEVPYGDEKNLNQISNKICNGIRPDISTITNEKITDLIKKCWSGNPDERPTFDQVLDDITNPEFYSYFAGLDNNKVIEYLNIFGDEFNELKNRFNQNAPNIRDLTPDEINILTTTLNIPAEQIRILQTTLINAQRTASAESIRIRQSKIDFLCEATGVTREVVEIIYEFTDHSVENASSLLLMYK